MGVRTQTEVLFGVAPNLGGHCAVTGQEAARVFHGAVAKMLAGSTNSAVFPRVDKASETFEKGMRRWLPAQHQPECYWHRESVSIPLAAS